MPVSKKRKPKKVKRTAPPQAKTVAPPPKITKQRILIYIISALMIFSLIGGYLFSGASPQPAPQSDDIVQETPAPAPESDSADN